MSKFIAASDIPADMQAVAFWTTSQGNTMWQMSKSVRGAKSIASRHSSAPSYGWKLIENNDRVHGLMIW